MGMANTKPKLTIGKILRWADAHRRRTGCWPSPHSGPIPESPGDSWSAIDACLSAGYRGLPAGGTLAQLLALRRGRRHKGALPGLSEAQILRWADAHRRRAGAWPTRNSGPIPGSGEETWLAVDGALYHGRRGLPGGDSLARLLARARGRNRNDLPALEVGQILRWADAHHARTGKWPAANTGPVYGAPGESWGAINSALVMGYRTLPGGSSLAALLAEHRGRRNRAAVPPLSEALILAWADAHHARGGRWPHASSGPVADAPGENWHAINQALAYGARGLPGGDSLARLLVRHGRRPALHDRADSGGWTAEELDLVRTLRPEEAARRTGRSLRAVYQRRYLLGVPSGGKRR
jgi:hypothetical protein